MENKKWRATNQRQFFHMGKYCSIETTIAYDGGELTVTQRIIDSQWGYDEAKARMNLIVRAVNSHADLLATAKGLAAEATGFLAFASITDHGQTNINVLRHWIAKTNAAIAAAEPTTEAKS